MESRKRNEILLTTSNSANNQERWDGVESGEIG